MGANGSHASGVLHIEEGRTYKTLFSMGDNIKVIEPKNPNRKGKLPEESHMPNRIYVSFMANGEDVKEIAKYGDDGKKLWSIHTLSHKGISPHYHNWKDGAQLKDAYALTTEMKSLLDKIRNYGTK